MGNPAPSWKDYYIILYDCCLGLTASFLYVNEELVIFILMTAWSKLTEKILCLQLMQMDQHQWLGYPPPVLALGIYDELNYL